MVFGLLKLLGVAYRPELADLPDQKLWRIDPTHHPPRTGSTARRPLRDPDLPDDDE